MIDEALTNERHRLEPAVRMLWEPGHDAAVVHAPAVGAGEVHPDVARRERRVRAQVLVALRVLVEVVDAEQERVDGHPLHAEGDRLQHRISHACRLRPI